MTLAHNEIIQPADSEDIWFRHLLFETEMVDGVLHPKFFLAWL